MSPFSSIRITRPSAGLFSKGMDTGATRRQVMVRLAQTMRVVLGDLKKKHESKMFANKNGWAMNHPSNLLGVRSGKLKKSFTHGVKTEGSVVTGTRESKGSKYAGIHEHGGTISSGKNMWIPLPGVKMTPREFRDKKVFYLKRKAGEGKVAMLITGKKSFVPKFTLLKSVTIPKRDILNQAQREIMSSARNKFQNAVVAVLEGR